jgi:hypothetical protein
MSAGTNTYKVLFSYDDESRPDMTGRASGTQKIGHVKDEDHARRIFKLKYADRYKNAKITRVTQVKSSVDDSLSPAEKVVADLLSERSDRWGAQKSDETLNNDARHVLTVLGDTGLIDELLNDHDEDGRRQWLRITLSADEEDALPGFHNLFSNMSREDLEKVVDIVLAKVDQYKRDNAED